MNYLNKYEPYNEQPKIDFDITFNTKYNCLKIGELYLFMNEEKAYLEHELPLNESFFGIDWSDFLPKTTSDWIHLSADVVTGIVSVLGPVGYAVSVVLEIIHGLSYFVEAYYDKPNETSLMIGGAITLIMAFIPAGAVGNIVAKTAKRGGKSILKAVYKGTGAKMTIKMMKFLMSFGKVTAKTTSVLQKNADSWWLKGLKKLPGVEKIFEIAPKQLKKFEQKITKHLLNGEIKPAIKAMNTYFKQNSKLSYKALPKATQKIINEKDYWEIFLKFSNKSLPSLEDIKLNPSKFVDLFDEKKLPLLMKNVEKTITGRTNSYKTILDNGFKNSVENPLARKFFSRNFNRKANKLVVKSLKEGVEPDPSIVSKFVKNYFEAMTPTTLKGFMRRGIRKGIPMALKAKINDITRDEEVVAPTPATPVVPTPTPVDSVGDGDDIVSNQKIKGGKKKESDDRDFDMMNEFNLTDSNIDRIEEMFSSKIIFEAPNRKGEKGELYLSGGVYKTFDLGDDIKLYDDEEELYDDLVKIGKKKAGKKKKNVRKGEMKKWEKSPLISTPYIKEMDNQRFEFDFLIRERAKVSLGKKKDEIVIDWTKVFESGFVENKSYKINNSLYITLENIVKEK